MRVLLVKLSSLGDVIHNLPVVSDLARAHPGIEIDWAVEKPYVEIVGMHPAVKRVWPVPLRLLKKNPFAVSAWSEFLRCRRQIVRQHYDQILDTQGLVKSAWVSHWPEGPVSGYSRESAREPFAARFYDRTFAVSRDLHAVERNRLLAAKAFGYEIKQPLSYGLKAGGRSPSWLPLSRYVVFLHATSRRNKMWPDQYWIELGNRLKSADMHVLLPWGNANEKETADRLSGSLANATVPPAMSLTEAAAMLIRAVGVVGVDTGLAHFSVALERPTIGLYLTTQPKFTGLQGGTLAVNLGGGSEEQPSIPQVDKVWDTLSPWLGQML